MTTANVVDSSGWPDFGIGDLHAAIRAFSLRNRRCGALDNTNTLAGR